MFDPFNLAVIVFSFWFGRKKVRYWKYSLGLAIYSIVMFFIVDALVRHSGLGRASLGAGIGPFVLGQLLYGIGRATSRFGKVEL